MMRHAIAAAALTAALGVTAWALFGPSVAAPVAVTRTDFPGERPRGAVEVDAELVLAVDISYSMDPDEQALQREGYVFALTSPEFLEALKGGARGKVAVTYVEWAGSNDQRIMLPWRLIDGEASARAVAEELMRVPYRRAYRTSIAGALRFSAPLFEDNGYSGLRRIIDVSGDGTNNQGPLVTVMRDAVLARGITINGLPILLKRPNAATMDIDDLDIYYEDCVIGGPGAFVVPIRERGKFREATRTKLVMEIAGRMPPARIAPAAAAQPRVSCTIGERMWQDRWGSGGLDFR